MINLSPANRRKRIVEHLKDSAEPVSASSLASMLGVSRQVIVGDIALIRVSGTNILSTPRGYLLEAAEKLSEKYGYVGTVACRHTQEQLTDELNTIIDFGGTVLDVVIEHSVYGQLTGILNLSSRYDITLFIQNLEENRSQPLCSLTGGVHIHHIGCRNEENFNLICSELKKINVVFS
ncbi:MAG: transcription repressor NadR [Clostridia bacterium]|nr:transcription repressor NadR [Clostridia bacterium]